MRLRLAITSFLSPIRTLPSLTFGHVPATAEIFSGKTGTLVVWSKLDKIQWKTARALIDNTATEVGRIHRHYLSQDMVRIRAASFLQRRPS